MENQENQKPEEVQASAENASTEPTENTSETSVPPITDFKKADIVKRFLAFAIDSFAAFLVGFVPIIGGLAGGAYILVRDGLDTEFMKKRSLGKKIMKLKPLTLEGKDLTLEDSVRRNWVLALGSLCQILMFIPIIGWILIPLVGIAAMVLLIVEIFLVLSDDKGIRLGDKWARTIVIESDE